MNSIQTGSATVTRTENHDGSIWKLAPFDKIEYDLAAAEVDIVRSLQRSGEALSAVATEGNTRANEDRQLAALITAEETRATGIENGLRTDLDDEINTNRDKAIEDALAAFEIADDAVTEPKIAAGAVTADKLDAALQTDINNATAKLATIPDMPTAAGKYNLVITASGATWEEVV